MIKKLVTIGVVLLLLIGGGIFLWQESQKDVMTLNKNLPEGVSVSKSLFGNDYRVMNKIDGYEFAVPRLWQGVNKIEYTPEREEEGFKGTSILVSGKEGPVRTISVDIFNVSATEDLKQWAQNFINTFGFAGSLEEQKLFSDLIAVRIAEDPLSGPYMYFFKTGSKLYVLTGGSEEFIREIITNGEW